MKKFILFIACIALVFPAIASAQYEQPYGRFQNLYIGGTQVTATASELNSLDGVTKTANELNSATVTVSTTVDASAGGTAQTATLNTIPATSLLLNVLVVVDTPFDGDTTTTLEVGVSGNIDNYIDTTDFDPSNAAGTAANSLGGTTNDQTLIEYVHTATELIATWTNTANASAGQVTVYITYINTP